MRTLRGLREGQAVDRPTIARERRIIGQVLEFTLCGAVVGSDEMADLIRTLLDDGDADCVAAADKILAGIGEGRLSFDLDQAQRDAVLGVLNDPPDGLLELRGILARDHERRIA
jgi:hypothetical protein